jgi:hypothetical protein
MNCLSNKSGAWKLSSSRGFYVHGREDHITSVLFHIWAAFPDCCWVHSLLDLWKVEHGTIKRVKWSYSWEQKRDLSRRPDITDIVLCWEDEHGQAVLVVEAKRRGGKMSDKDINGGAAYLQMPSVRPFKRKSVAFLVDDADMEAASAILPMGTSIASWQSVGRLQAHCASQLRLSASARELICSYVVKHYADLGFPLGAAWILPTDQHFDGSKGRYDAIKSLGFDGSIERFLLGSEVSFCAREGHMPHPPLEWLAREPSFIDIVLAKKQSTSEREQPLWRL